MGSNYKLLETPGNYRHTLYILTYNMQFSFPANLVPKLEMAWGANKWQDYCMYTNDFFTQSMNLYIANVNFPSSNFAWKRKKQEPPAGRQLCKHVPPRLVESMSASNLLRLLEDSTFLLRAIERNGDCMAFMPNDVAIDQRFVLMALRWGVGDLVWSWIPKLFRPY